MAAATEQQDQQQGEEELPGEDPLGQGRHCPGEPQTAEDLPGLVVLLADPERLPELEPLLAEPRGWVAEDLPGLEVPLAAPDQLPGLELVLPAVQT